MAETEAEVQESQIRPIPPGASPFGSLGNARPDDHAEPEQEQEQQEAAEEQEPEKDDNEGKFFFANRYWDSAAQAEAAFKALRGRENPKDQKIRELEAELERREEEKALLASAKERAVEEVAPTKAETAEVKQFLKTLTKEQIAEFNDLREEKGDAYAFSWLLNNYDSFQGGRIDKLEKLISDLKRSAIDEPAEVAQRSEEWAQNLDRITRNAKVLAEEGEGPFAELFAQVFPPDADTQVFLRNVDEVHKLMLDPDLNLEDTPQGFAAAALMWHGYNSLPSVRKNVSSTRKGRRQSEDDEDQQSDPAITTSRAGSRPRSSDGEPSFLGQSSRVGPLGKL